MRSSVCAQVERAVEKICCEEGSSESLFSCRVLYLDSSLPSFGHFAMHTHIGDKLLPKPLQRCTGFFSGGQLLCLVKEALFPGFFVPGGLVGKSNTCLI